MKNFILLLSVCLTMTKSFAALPGLLSETIKKEKLQVDSSVQGDLNNDGKDDFAVILLKPKSEAKDNSEFEPSLRIYLTDTKSGFSLLQEGRSVVCYDCGGAKGGAGVAQALTIKKGILNINDNYGSRQDTSVKSKWRLKEKKLELIGLTHQVFDTMVEKGGVYSIKSDVNYLSGMIEETVTHATSVTDDNVKSSSKVVKCKIPKATPETLETFDARSFVVPRCTQVEISE